MMLIHNEEYEALIAARDELADLKAILTAEDDLTSGIAEGWVSEDEEEDFLAGATCNPNAPEECESCQ